jgi:adhesin transport system outer membrane protein
MVVAAFAASSEISYAQEVAPDQKKYDFGVAIRDLVSSDRRVLSLEKQILAAEEELKTAKFKLLPSLSVTGDTGREFIDSPSKRSSGSDGSNLFRKKIGATISQKIFDPSLYSSIKTSAISVDILKSTLQSIKSTVLLDGLISYFELIKSYKNFGYQTSKEALVKQLLNIESIRVDQGSGLAVDELQARSALQSAAQQTVISRGQYRSASERFRGFFGDFDVDKLLESEIKISDFDGDLDQFVAESIDKNPQIFQLQQAVLLANEARKSSENNFLPTLSLDGSSNWEKDAGGELSIRRDWSVLMKLNWALSPDLFPSTRSASARALAALDDLKFTEDTLSRELRANVESYKAAASAVLFARNTLNIAEEIYKAQKKKSAEGQLTEVELVGALMGVFDARVNFITAKYDRNILRATIYNDLGVLDLGKVVPDA